MIHRVISCGNFPLYLLGHIKHTGCIGRAHSTDYRGPVAFVGLERIWAVGTMHDCKQGTSTPSTKVKVRDHAGRDTGEKKTLPGMERYFWCFSEISLIPEELHLRCGKYDGTMWESPRGLEPQALNTGAQAVLTQFLADCDLIRRNGVDASRIAREAREQGIVTAEPVANFPQEILTMAQMLERSGRNASDLAEEVVSTVCESGKRKGQLEMVW